MMEISCGGGEGRERRVKGISSILLLLLLLFLLCLLFGSPIHGGGLYYRGFGATQVVSGSLHLITLDGDTLILDAGSFMGSDGEGIPPITPDLLQEVQGIIISHAHSDHIGRLLELVKKGYSNPIYMTSPTKKLLPVMLTMAARYGSLGEEAYYYSRSSYERNTRANRDTPVHTLPDCEWGRRINLQNIETLTFERSRLDELNLYLCSHCIEREVEEVMKYVVTRPLDQPFSITPRITASFHLTPHIPGSVMVYLEGESGISLLYTGDYGSGLSPFLPDQEKIRETDWALVEGTYGPRLPESLEDRDPLLQEIRHYLLRGDRVIIPAFVLDRSQQILYELYRGREEGFIPEETSILVLGSSVHKINHIYHRLFTQEKYHPYICSLFLEEGPLDLFFYEDLVELREVEPGEIIITSPGMAHGGYARELIEMYLEEEDTVILFVGYLSPETLGGRLIETVGRGKEEIRIDDSWYRIEAEIEQVAYFRGHGRPEEIGDFLAEIEGLSGILLVHSSYSTSLQLKEYYQRLFPELEILIPEGGREYHLQGP